MQDMPKLGWCQCQCQTAAGNTWGTAAPGNLEQGKGVWRQVPLDFVNLGTLPQRNETRELVNNPLTKVITVLCLG